jgi:hypothetical protein
MLLSGLKGITGKRPSYQEKGILYSKLVWLNYMQIAQIIGLLALSLFGFYALEILSSFRNGVLARSWRYISIGAIVLISAQFPLIAAGIGLLAAENTSLIILGTLMRLIGILFLAIGLRSQSRVWNSKGGIQAHGEGRPSSGIEV